MEFKFTELYIYLLLSTAGIIVEWVQLMREVSSLQRHVDSIVMFKEKI